LSVLATGCLSVACGGDHGRLPAAWNSPPPTALKVELGHVTNTEYAFRMAYPVSWLRSTWQKEPGSPSASTLQFLLSYADPGGAQVKGSYVDGEQVAVHLLSRSVLPGEVSREGALRIVRGVMLKDLPGFGFRREMDKVDVHGDTGWLVDYSYRIGTMTIWARSILVLKGKYAYWVTGQSSSTTWNSVYPPLETALSYFRVD
jgi:hypothetical protein